jgi:hypothetical protein
LGFNRIGRRAVMALLWRMIWLYTIGLIGVNILMAWWHARLLKQSRPIKHGWWGLSYLILTAFLAYLSGSVLLAVNSLFIRKVFFDTALNLFNGRAIFFVSKETTSLIDRVHYWAFGMHSEIYMTIYLMVSVILTIWSAK